jgi:23S rRNA (pseudouridine1915-N3)-methyltransferase
MNIKLIVIGKLKEKYLRDACDEYIKRLSKFCNLKVVELDECKL